MVPGETILYFHVSSKKSSKSTDSGRYMNNIFWALQEMKKVCEEVYPESKK